MSFRVLEPGLCSLVVDDGRRRFRSLGVPVGGAADRASLALGNGLVGNLPDAPALETTLVGPVLEAMNPVGAVIFGSPFVVTINGREARPGVTFTVRAGDVLRIAGTPSSPRGYLCVPGGFDGPEVLASRSALAKIVRGDVLLARPSALPGRSLPFVGPNLEPGMGPPDGSLRVVAGPQADWFDLPAFLGSEYRVTPASDRMGARLAGPPLVRVSGELASEPVAPGAVQVTNDGQCIVLGTDGQTIGGYPKVAHVIGADLDALGQLRPGASVRFAQVTVEEAEAIACRRRAAIDEWLTRLRVIAYGT